jgi:hypothetical protein
MSRAQAEDLEEEKPKRGTVGGAGNTKLRGTNLRAEQCLEVEGAEHGSHFRVVSGRHLNGKGARASETKHCCTKGANP